MSILALAARLFIH